jgi:hypothetical protein
VLAKQPDNGRTLNGRAWAAAQKGDLDKALADSSLEPHGQPSMAKPLKLLYLICRKRGMGERDMTARETA